jgi:hypothetical protein
VSARRLLSQLFHYAEDEQPLCPRPSASNQFARRSQLNARQARVLGLLVFLAATPAGAWDALDLAAQVIKKHQLLTPERQRCMTLVQRDDSSAKIAKVGVYERHDKACGGDPAIEHRLFDLEIDVKTGAAKWDNNFPDMEMRPVPKRRR